MCKVYSSSSADMGPGRMTCLERSWGGLRPRRWAIKKSSITGPLQRRERLPHKTARGVEWECSLPLKRPSIIRTATSKTGALWGQGIRMVQSVPSWSALVPPVKGPLLQSSSGHSQKGTLACIVFLNQYNFLKKKNPLGKGFRNSSSLGILGFSRILHGGWQPYFGPCRMVSPPPPLQFCLFK